MSAKCPWRAPLMGLAGRPGSWGSWFCLRWVARDQNQEAGTLANGFLRQFRPVSRVKVIPAAMGGALLVGVLGAGGALTGVLARLRAEKLALRDKACRGKGVTCSWQDQVWWVQCLTAP